jgi:rhodanese-related sulfurtransferase
MTASWFRQMGYPNAYVLDGGTTAWQEAGLQPRSGIEAQLPFGFEAAARRVSVRSPMEVRGQQLAALRPEVVFVGTSDEFSEGHLAGSQWLPRSWLEIRVAESGPAKARPVVVTCPDAINSTLAGATLLDLGYQDVAVLQGGIKAWQAAGLPLEKGLSGVSQAPDDVLPARRSYAEMLNYLRWEEQLGEKYHRPE